MPDPTELNLHKDIALFREAVNFTASRTGFNPHLIEMVRQKLTVPGNSPVDVGPERLADLKRQLNTRLRTVLRDKDFQAFDLDQAFRLVTAMAERLA